MPLNVLASRRPNILKSLVNYEANSHRLICMWHLRTSAHVTLVVTNVRSVPTGLRWQDVSGFDPRVSDPRRICVKVLLYDVISGINLNISFRNFY